MFCKHFDFSQVIPFFFHKKRVIFFFFITGGLPPEGKIKQPLLVTTAHMHWDPEFSDVKLIQTMMLMSELKKVVEESYQVIRPDMNGQAVDCNSIPMILCGDLNSLPESGLFI